MKHSGRASRFLRTWREDYIYQTLTGAAVSCGITALFALYNGYLGVQHGSIWHGSIAVFYLLLTAIRGTVLLTEQRNRMRRKAEQEQCRRRTFRTSATLLLALDLALILPISMMTVLAKPVVMGLIPAIAMAAYTTWKIVMASIHIRRQRSRAQGSILIAELRTLNFIDALVAILTLQNTLIMVRRTAMEGNAMLPVSAASSGIVYAVIVVISVRMLYQGVKR